MEPYDFIEFSRSSKSIITIWAMVLGPVLLSLGLFVWAFFDKKHKKGQGKAAVGLIVLAILIILPYYHLVKGIDAEVENKVKQTIADSGTTVNDEEFDILYNNSTLFKDKKAISANCDLSECSVIIVPLKE